jgi:O-antigen/teichoic acid export membrane protein
VYLIARERPRLRPRPRRVHREAVSTILATGGLFFILQVAGAVAYQSDSLILAQMLGPEAVAQYAVPMKLFTLTPMLLGMAYGALWPAYGESLARGDLQWARIALNRSLKLALGVSIPASLFLTLAGPWIIRVWVGPVIAPTALVLSAMGLWTVVSAVSVAVANFLNGAGVLRFQALCAVLMMVANVVLSIIITRAVGISGVVWGSVISQAVLVLIPYVIYLRRHLWGQAPRLEAD